MENHRESHSHKKKIKVSRINYGVKYQTAATKEPNTRLDSIQNSVKEKKLTTHYQLLPIFKWSNL